MRRSGGGITSGLLTSRCCVSREGGGARSAPGEREGIAHDGYRLVRENTVRGGQAIFRESRRRPGSGRQVRVLARVALVIGVCGKLEAQVNALSQELALRDGLSILDQSILLEKDYSLDKGVFNLTAKLKMYRLEDRVVLILKTLTARAEGNKEVWGGQVNAAIDHRNDIVHPKTVADLSEERVERALSAVLE